MSVPRIHICMRVYARRVFALRFCTTRCWNDELILGFMCIPASSPFVQYRVKNNAMGESSQSCYSCHHALRSSRSLGGEMLLPKFIVGYWIISYWDIAQDYFDRLDRMILLSQKISRLIFNEISWVNIDWILHLTCNRHEIIKRMMDVRSYIITDKIKRFFGEAFK
jgi:hypothetical protein